MAEPLDLEAIAGRLGTLAPREWRAFLIDPDEEQLLYEDVPALLTALQRERVLRTRLVEWAWAERQAYLGVLVRWLPAPAPTLDLIRAQFSAEINRLCDMDGEGG